MQATLAKGIRNKQKNRNVYAKGAKTTLSAHRVLSPDISRHSSKRQIQLILPSDASLRRKSKIKVDNKATYVVNVRGKMKKK